MIHKIINWFDGEKRLACDANCFKAWGINRRPSEQLSGDPDDYEYLADHELAVAPENPGTYEGGHAKPCSPEERLNKWCARECERSRIVPKDWPLSEIRLPDFSGRQRNITPEEDRLPDGPSLDT